MADSSEPTGGDFDDFISAFDTGFKKLTTGSDAHIEGRELTVEPPRPLTTEPEASAETIYVRYGYVGPQDAGSLQPYIPPGQLAPATDDRPLPPTHDARKTHFSPP